MQALKNGLIYETLNTEQTLDPPLDLYMFSCSFFSGTVHGSQRKISLIGR